MLLVAACGSTGRAREERARERALAEQAFAREVEPTLFGTRTVSGAYHDLIYARAFRARGIDPDAQTTEEALAALEAADMPVALAAALDGWALACIGMGDEHYQRGNVRRSLADALDREDETRRKLRWAFLETNLGGIRDTSLDLADTVLECSDAAACELSPATALLLANTLDYADETARAVEVLQAAARIHPDHPSLVARLGHYLIFSRPRRAAEAVELMPRAIALDPANPLQYAILAYAQYLSDLPQEALKSCRAALELDPEFTWAYRVRWLTYSKSGEHQAAADAYRDLVRTAPDHAPWQNGLAWTLATGPDPAVHAGDDAVSHALRAIEIDPAQSAYVNTLGVSYYRAGRFSDAIETLERSIAIDGIGKLSDHLFLAMAWKKEGEDAIAMETLGGAFDWIEKHTVSVLEFAEALRFLEDACELMGVELVTIPQEGSEDGN
ncbi:MAG: hypothetical protein V3T22_01130 [Planctomycetota bacterium]